MEILQKYNVRTPKILYMNKDYSIQEYIEGQLLSDIFEDHEDIDKNIIKHFIYTKWLIRNRSMLYHVYWTDLTYQSNDKIKRDKQLGHFMRRYNKLCEYEVFDLKPETQIELDCIFEEYRKFMGEIK